MRKSGDILRLLHVCGARPNFMKVAPVMAAVEARNAAEARARSASEPAVSLKAAKNCESRWTDGCNTAYTVRGLYDVWRTTEDDEALASLKRGMGAYIQGLFAQGGVPKYSTVGLYPVDIHSAASAITILLRAADVDERCEGLARGVTRWTIANLYDPSAYFYYQKTRWYTNRIPYVRWSQAHMFAALAALAAATRQ